MIPMNRKGTFRENVKRHILQNLFLGNYRPGDKITEMSVAGELGVSQSVVREAFADLRAKNILEVIPYKETRIRAFSKEEITDAITVRMEIEEIAFRRIEKSDRDISELVSDLQSIRNQMKTCMDTKDYLGFRENDIEFHRRIFVDTGSPLLVHLWDILGDMGWIYLGLLMGDKNALKFGEEDRRAIYQTYGKFIQAFKTGDFMELSRLHWELKPGFIA